MKFTEHSWNEANFFLYDIHNVLYETNVLGVTKLLKAQVKIKFFSMGYCNREPWMQYNVNALMILLHHIYVSFLNFYSVKCKQSATFTKPAAGRYSTKIAFLQSTVFYQSYSPASVLKPGPFKKNFVVLQLLLQITCFLWSTLQQNFSFFLFACKLEICYICKGSFASQRFNWSNQTSLWEKWYWRKEKL